MRIGIIAGEASGDILGAGLIKAVHARYPDAQFEGVAGPEMIAAGCKALYPSDTLAIFGLFEVLRHLPRLLRLRRALWQHFLDNPPDLFIGIDAPDFNLPFARHLRESGIATAHYVSPSVWAWRPGRVVKIAASVDLMLTLFPFEAKFYAEHDMRVVCVGHTLADDIPDQVDAATARQSLGLDPNVKTLAVLPGSRMGELKFLGRIFLLTVVWLRQQRPDLQVVIPLANNRIRQGFELLRQRYAPDMPLRLVDGRSREVMAAADGVLLASGTATLEAMLLKRPMVVAYKLSWLTYLLVKWLRLMNVKVFSLPNLLSGREDLVPEYIQGDATPDKLGPAVLAALEDASERDEQQQTFARLHGELRRNASEVAAAAVIDLIQERHAAQAR